MRERVWVRARMYVCVYVVCVYGYVCVFNNIARPLYFLLERRCTYRHGEMSASLAAFPNLSRVVS